MTVLSGPGISLVTCPTRNGLSGKEGLGEISVERWRGGRDERRTVERRAGDESFNWHLHEPGFLSGRLVVGQTKHDLQLPQSGWKTKTDSDNSAGIPTMGDRCREVKPPGCHHACRLAAGSAIWLSCQDLDVTVCVSIQQSSPLKTVPVLNRVPRWAIPRDGFRTESMVLKTPCREGHQYTLH